MNLVADRDNRFSSVSGFEGRWWAAEAPVYLSLPCKFHSNLMYLSECSLGPGRALGVVVLHARQQMVSGRATRRAGS
jgi:hypothetical protein